MDLSGPWEALLSKRFAACLGVAWLLLYSEARKIKRKKKIEKCRGFPVGPPASFQMLLPRALG